MSSNLEMFVAFSNHCYLIKLTSVYFVQKNKNKKLVQQQKHQSHVGKTDL